MILYYRIFFKKSITSPLKNRFFEELSLTFELYSLLKVKMGFWQKVETHDEPKALAVNTKLLVPTSLGIKHCKGDRYKTKFFLTTINFVFRFLF